MTNYKSDLMRIGQIYGWHVYLIAEAGGEFCKVGSAARVHFRLSSLQTGNPRRLTIFKSWHLDDREIARSVEAGALKALGDRRLDGSEWVKCSAEEAAVVIESEIERRSARLRTDLEPRWGK